MLGPAETATPVGGKDSDGRRPGDQRCRLVFSGLALRRFPSWAGQAKRCDSLTIA
jgi:hypothetical protein